jgi:hypothetical protein
LIFSADVIEQVREIKPAVTFARLDGEACPHVMATDNATRRFDFDDWWSARHKIDVVELAPVRMIGPELPAGLLHRPGSARLVLLDHLHLWVNHVIQKIGLGRERYHGDLFRKFLIRSERHHAKLTGDAYRRVDFVHLRNYVGIIIAPDGRAGILPAVVLRHLE